MEIFIMFKPKDIELSKTQIVFVNSETQQKIVLQKMIHIAPNSFYQKINQEIEQQFQQQPDNTLVLFEEVKKQKETSQSILNDLLEKLTLLDDFDLKNAYSFIANLLGISAQKNDELFTSNQIKQENVINSDMSQEDLSQIFIKDGLIEKAQTYYDFYKLKEVENYKLINRFPFIKHFFEPKEIFTFEEVKEKTQKHYLVKFILFFIKQFHLSEHLIKFILSKGKLINNIVNNDNFNIDFKDDTSILTLPEIYKIKDKEERKKHYSVFIKNNPVDNYPKEYTKENEEFFKCLQIYILKQFLNIILYKRNLTLIENIEKYISVKENEQVKYKTIYITYGAMHFSNKLPEKYNIFNKLTTLGFKQVI